MTEIGWKCHIQTSPKEQTSISYRIALFRGSKVSSSVQLPRVQRGEEDDAAVPQTPLRYIWSYYMSPLPLV